MNDENERSDGSTGSVDAPVAFGVTRVGGRWVAIFDNPVQAETSRQYFDACENREHAITPLYSQPQPTLTDAEREAVASSREFWLSEAACELRDETDQRYADALGGLLERLG